MATQRFTIEVSAVELEVVALALGRMPDAKPVRERKAASAPVVPIFDTGNDALDDFMRRSWKPANADAAAKRHAAHLPAHPPLKPRKWTQSEHHAVAAFNDSAVAAWRRLGHEAIVTGERGIDANGANVRVLPLGVSA